MHKGIILLVKKEKNGSVEDIQHKVDSFLEPYGDGQIWDYYTIGGRWAGILDKYCPEKDPANIEECWLCKGTGKRNDTLGKKARKENPKYTCNGCNGKGKKVKFIFEKHDDDILPLSKCIDVVKEWQQDPKEEADKIAQQYKENYPKDDADLGTKGYYMTIQGNLLSQNFCFDTNVYNIKTWDYSIPKDLKNWYAVVIDIHN